jgi:hypothetical protein
MAETKFQLPAAEDDLWHEVVLALLGQRDADEEQARNHLHLLEELAFHHRFCGKALTGAFAEDTATWLAEAGAYDRVTPRKTAQGWLAHLERWQLLDRHGSGNEAVYEFAIPTLDEYFAARYLAARWAQGDGQYRRWFPDRRRWWWRGTRLRCPDPYCGTLLPPFPKLIRRTDHEETLLLLVGLLREAEREACFLAGMRGQLNLTLKALGRCRHSHDALTAAAGRALRREFGALWRCDEGLSAVGRARVEAVRVAIVTPLIAALRGWGSHDHYWVVQALGLIGDRRAVPPLHNRSGCVRAAAKEALKEIKRRGGTETA